MYEACVVCQAELDASLRSAYIDILNVGALGEMFHIGRAIKHRVDWSLVCVRGLKQVREIGCHIAVNDENPRAEELVEAPAEVVEEHVLQSSFGIVAVLSSHEACDCECVGLQ